MTNYILLLILFVLIIGIVIINKKLKDIKKIRIETKMDYKEMSDIVKFLGRKWGWYNGSNEP